MTITLDRKQMELLIGLLQKQEQAQWNNGKGFENAPNPLGQWKQTNALLIELGKQVKECFGSGYYHD
jgi:hypothetical protein